MQSPILPAANPPYPQQTESCNLPVDNTHTWDADDGTNYDDSVTAAQGNNIPDCNYTNSAGYRAIPTMRDLEDFARLWT